MAVSSFFTAPLAGKINANKNCILPKSLARQLEWIGSNVDFICVRIAQVCERRGCKYGVSGRDEEAMMEW